MTGDKAPAPPAEASLRLETPEALFDRPSPGARARHAYWVNRKQELLAPLNAILELSEMLVRDARARAHEGLLADLEQVQGAAGHMRTMLRDLLDPAQGGAGEDEFARRMRHDLRTPLTHI